MSPQETWEMLNLKELCAVSGRKLLQKGCSIQTEYLFKSSVLCTELRKKPQKKVGLAH